MKKIVFVLVVLLFTAPAWALTTVTIDANQIGDTNQVEISYEVTGDVNLPRAFGLDITVTDGNIVACIPFMVGECNDPIRGFGIFPGTIDILTDGTVNDYGNPYAPPGATGALGGLDTNGITIEMGSLYEDSNYPPSQGLLCTITVTQDCNVNIVGNAARCGEGSPALGVVMENPDEIPTVTYVPGTVVMGCFPSAHADWAEWDTVGRPPSWCIPRQCHGDADGLQELIGKGTFWVGYNDLGIFIDAWKDAPLDYAADFTHSDELIGKGTFRVGYIDLAVFIANWKDVLGSDPNCLDVP